jgi:hypothetical protein
MQRFPHEEVNALLGLAKESEEVEQTAAFRLRKVIVEKFREKLTVGAPADQGETGLRRLAAQVKARTVIVKLFLWPPSVFRHRRPPSIRRSTGASSHSAFGLVETGPFLGRLTSFASGGILG